MGKTIITYKIDGQATEPFRESENITISADFGTEVQPSVSLDRESFLDSAGALNSQKLLELWTNLPTEGADFDLEISDGTTTIVLDFFFDYTKMIFLSDVETSSGLIKKQSLDEFDFRAQGITQGLLNSKGFLGNQQYSPVPYVVENRKTLLEKIQILSQTFATIKAIIDEVHKIVNIASDLPTLGIIAAGINLTLTLAGITALAIQLKNLLIQIQDAFFPPVRYHSGLKPKVFIEKSLEYMGYAGVDFGTLTSIMDELTWLGSKNNEKGVAQYLDIFLPGNLLQIQSGLFKAGDNGYFLIDAIDILTNQFRLRRAIINNVLHLRPENDPFWVTQSGYQLPEMKVEQIFAQNGTIRPNYEDVQSSLIIEYSTDDSDKWTLDDLADEADPNSTGKLITVKTITPINVNDERKTLLRGAKIVNIPHCLAVRKNAIDDLFDLFLGSAAFFDDFKDELQTVLDTWAQVLSVGNPAIESFVSTLGNRTGAMKIENDFFSVPKQMLLETNSQGFPTIPETFVSVIGTRALVDNFHSWDSFVPGVRDPNDPTKTAAKFVFEEVRIPFGLQDFVTTLNNAYFTTQTGETGKFIKIDWNVRGDFAIVSYWIYNNWLNNIEETIT